PALCPLVLNKASASALALMLLLFCSTPTIDTEPIYLLAEGRAVLDTLFSVVVDFVSLLSAAGAAVLLAGQFYLNVSADRIFPNIFYDYVFQTEQFCCIIFHRA
ncbi:MAG: hypothetical protein LUD55_05575, partial [Oscillospiraceae bacterium]|nr:hypothetical protein [Oscillospiraceae bacterium]